jgi:hypothetical protein
MVTKHPDQIEGAASRTGGYSKRTPILQKREGDHLAVRVEHAESEQATRVGVQPQCRSRVLAHLLDCANSQESLSSRGHAALTRQDTSCISILVGRGHSIFRSSTEEIG